MDMRQAAHHLMKAMYKIAEMIYNCRCSHKSSFFVMPCPFRHSRFGGPMCWQPLAHFGNMRRKKRWLGKSSGTTNSCCLLLDFLTYTKCAMEGKVVE